MLEHGDVVPVEEATANTETFGCSDTTTASFVNSALRLFHFVRQSLALERVCCLVEFAIGCTSSTPSSSFTSFALLSPSLSSIFPVAFPGSFFWLPPPVFFLACLPSFDCPSPDFSLGVRLGLGVPGLALWVPGFLSLLMRQPRKPQVSS